MSWSCVNFFAISLCRQISQIGSLVAISRGESIDLILSFRISENHEFANIT